MSGTNRIGFSRNCGCRGQASRDLPAFVWFCTQLAPVVAVAPAVVVAIVVAVVVVTVAAAIAPLEAHAVRALVVAFRPHPVFEAAGVFPVVVFEIEMAAAIGVVLAGAKAVSETVSVSMLAGLVVPVVVIVGII